MKTADIKWMQSLAHSCVLAFCAFVLSDTPDLFAQDGLPVAEVKRAQPVSFENEIIPILRQNCLACHSAIEHEGGLNLETVADMIKGGDSGAAIVPGKPLDSMLYRLAAHLDEPVMPPSGNIANAKNLGPEQLGLLKLWIEQGAQAGSGSTTLSPQNWRPLPPGMHPIYATALTPDGQFVACSRANQIFIYHVTSGQLVTKLDDPSLLQPSQDQRPGVAHKDLVHALAFNPDGNLLASSGFREVKIWSRPRDVQNLKFDAGQGPLTAVAFQPEMKLLATSSKDGRIRLWNLKGELQGELAGHTAEVSTIRWSSTGDKLYSAGLDNKLIVWETSSRKKIGEINTPAPLKAFVALITPAAGNTPATTSLLTNGSDNAVHVWREPGELKRTRWLPDGETVLLSGKTNSLAVLMSSSKVVWVVDNASGVDPVRLPLAVTGNPVSIAVSPSSTLAVVSGKPTEFNGKIAVSYDDGAIVVTEIQKNLETASLAFRRPAKSVSALAFRADGKILVAGQIDGSVSYLNCDRESVEKAGGKLLDQIQLHTTNSDASRILIAGVKEGKPTALIFDREGGNTIGQFVGHAAPIRGISFSGDNSKIATASEDGEVRLWNADGSSGTELKKLTPYAGKPTSVALNGDGSQLLLGYEDNKVKLIQVADGVELKSFDGHTAAIITVGWDSNGQPFSVSKDNTGKSWNPADGQAIRNWNSPAPIAAGMRSRDGSRYLFSTTDNKVHLLNLTNGQLEKSLEGLNEPATSFGASQDAVLFYALSPRFGVAVWDFAQGKLLEILPGANLVGLASAPNAYRLSLLSADGSSNQRQVTWLSEARDLQAKLIQVAVRSDGNQVYAAAEDGSIRGYPTNGFNFSLQLQPSFSVAHGGAIRDFEVSPNEQLMGSVGSDQIVRVWQAANGAEYQFSRLQGAGEGIQSLVFVGEPLFVQAVTNSGRVCVFDLATGQLQEVLPTALSEAAESLPTPGKEPEGRVLLRSGEATVTKGWHQRAIPGHSQPVTSLAEVADKPGEFLSGSGDATIRRWNFVNGQQLGQWNHNGPVTSISFAPKTSRLAAASANKTVRLFNTQNNQQIVELKGDIRLQAKVNRTVQQQASTTTRINASKQRADAAEKDVPNKETIAKQAKEALDAANKGVEEKKTALATASQMKLEAEQLALDISAQIQALTLQKESAEAKVKEIQGAQQLVTAKIARINQAIQSDPTDEGLKQLLATTQAEQTRLQTEMQTATASVQAPSQQLTEMATKANEAAQKVTAAQKPYLDAVTAMEAAEREQNRASQNSVLTEKELEVARALVPQMKQALAENEERLKTLATELEAQRMAATQAELPIHSVQFDFNGEQMLFAGESAGLQVWDGDTGVPLMSYEGHATPHRGAVFLDQQYSCTIGDDGFVVIWERSPAWRLERTIGAVDKPEVLVDRVVSLAFSSDGKLLATGGGEPSRSGEIKVFNVATGEVVLQLPKAHDDIVQALVFGPDDKQIASGGADRFIKIHDAKSGEFIRRLEGHTHHVLGITWQTDGTTIASAGADNTVKVWEPISGDQLRTIEGFRKQVTGIRFIGETINIVTSCGDKTVRFHRANDGGNFRNINGAEDYLYCVDATPDSAIIVAGGHDSVLRIWNGNTGQAIQQLASPDSRPMEKK